MKFLSSFGISASALTAQRMRMDIIAQNIANANTTRVNGVAQTPYRRKVSVLGQQAPQRSFGDYLSESSSIGGGVAVNQIAEDQSPFKLIHDPTHPDADANGDVKMPNVDTMQEMMDMMSATRAYEANITVLNNSKSMALKALELGR